MLWNPRRLAERLVAAELRVITVSVVMALFSCAGTRPTDLGVRDGALKACPSSPNCVTSDAADPRHRIPPFELAVPATEAWQAARNAVRGLIRTRIITETDNYLHAECSSAWFGFVDDLELHLRPAKGIIALRSGARLGYSDLGVNRKRVERLRILLRERGVVR